VVTSSGDYEDYWFFELDLATETVSRIVRKCAQYLDYYRSGNEQRVSGVFPVVVWLVPNEKRKETLVRRMCEELPQELDIFTVIIPDELKSILINGKEDGQHDD
jgi:hypothetical protein